MDLARLYEDLARELRRAEVVRRRAQEVRQRAFELVQRVKGQRTLGGRPSHKQGRQFEQAPAEPRESA